MTANLQDLATPIGQYLTLGAFCTCTQTYRRYQDRIDPLPQNRGETIAAIQALCDRILDPIITHFSPAAFQLTYGFCSTDLKRFLAQTDPQTGQRNGRISPHLDQHMAHEKNKNGRYYCERLGAACDFHIQGISSSTVVDWIVAQQLPFDSLYFYGVDRPVHISHGPQHKRAIWAFTPQGTPTRRGTERWRGQFTQRMALGTGGGGPTE